MAGYKRQRAVCIRRVIALAVSTAMIFTLCSCWSRRELNTLAVVMGVGLDKGEDSGNVKVTAEIAKSGNMKGGTGEGGGGGGGSGGSKAYLNVDNTDESVFDAVRGLTHMVSRRLYFPHNQVIVLGRDIAGENVSKVLDFFEREYESRMNVFILVAKDKAGDIFDADPGLQKIPALQITEMLEAQYATSETIVVTLRDFTVNMLSKTSSPVAPIIQTYKEKDVTKTRLSGTAVFKDGKLAGELDETQTRGLLWVLNKVRSGVLHVNVPGGKLSLEIVRSNTKVTPSLREDGRICMNVSVEEEGIIGSAETSEDFTKGKTVLSIEADAEKAIKSEIESCIAAAKEYKTDIFRFGEAIHEKYPSEWEKMLNDWDTNFSNLEVNVTVDSKVRGTGEITKPIGPGGGA